MRIAMRAEHHDRARCLRLTVTVGHGLVEVAAMPT